MTATRMTTTAAIALLALAAAATPAPAQAAPAKPAEKAAPAAAEPSDVRSFTLATDAELADLNTLFATLYGKTGAKAGAKAPRFTAVPRSKSVIVRGTKAELDQAEAVVKLIQGAPPAAAGGTAAPAAQTVKLKVAKVDEVVTALTNLGLDGQVVALRGTNSLVLLPGHEADAPQVKKVIEALDKAEAKDPKAAKAPAKPVVND